MIEPPSRPPPTFLMSAISESISLSYFGPSGMRHSFSPMPAPAARSRLESCVLLQNKPARSWPRATMMAPVRVESSTIACGLNFSCAYHIASHRIRRPSASVLMTSTVWPDIDFTTSPGRCALPSGMFSTRAHTATTFALALRPAIRAMAPVTAPAPPMSHFMSSMPPAGFSEMPPVSKHTPLPISATGAWPLGPFIQVMTRSCESRPLPCPTASSVSMPSFFISASPSTSTFTPSLVSSRARRANSTG